MGKKLSKRYLMILLFPLGYLLNTLSRSNSVITERVYSNGVYRGISWVIGNLWGWLPFSLAELLLPVLVVVATWRIVVWVNRLIRSKGKRWIVLRNGILNILLVSAWFISSLLPCGTKLTGRACKYPRLEVRPLHWMS